MKKSRKVPILVLSLISAVFLIGAGVLFFLMPNIFGDMEFISDSFMAIKETFVVSFDNSAASITDVWYGAEAAVALGIIQLVFSGIVAFLLIFGIIFVSCNKRPASLLVQLLFAAAGFVGIVGIAVGVHGVKQFADYQAMDNPYAFLILLCIIFAVLGLLLAFVAYIVDLTFVSLTAKEANQQAEQASIITEAAPAQEAEEITYEAPRAEVLPEPEPEREPEPQPEPAPAPVEEKQDPQDLAALLRDLVRDAVKDEMSRNQPQPQQYGGPVVVQYFGNAAPTTAPVQEEPQPEPEPEPQPEPEPEPVVEEPAPEPEPEPEPVVEEPAPEPVPEPVVEEVEKVKYERISFAERLLQSEEDLHNLYNEIKNEILSWGVKSRISANGDTFRLHKKMYVRITVAGKSLKLYFALNPKDYENTTLPIQDASDKEMYQDIPLVFKVKSGLSLRRCKDLIQDVMEKDGLEQGEVEKVNWINELKAQAAEDEKKGEEDDD